MQRFQIDGIYDHGGECVMQRRDFLKMALAGAVSVPILGQGRRADAAPLITETFEGSNTLVNVGNAAQSLTGFDNPPGSPTYVGASDPFTGKWQSTANPAIDSTYPCPGGGDHALFMICDTTQFNFNNISTLYPGIKEFWFRIYMRFGNANSFSDLGNGVNWAKLIRVFSQTWQWQFYLEEYYNLGRGLLSLEQHPAGTRIALTIYPPWVPAKWFYHEFHVRPNTPGKADGLAEARIRNVSDNGPLYSQSFSGYNWTGGSTETLDIVRIGGNTDRVGYPANEVIRYANFAFSSSGWIGEIGGVGSPPSPPSLRAP